MIDTRELEQSHNREKPGVLSAPKSELTTVTDSEVRIVPNLERVLVDRYVDRAMLRTLTKQYAEGGWFAVIVVVPNVWGGGDTEAAAIADLEAVLRHWIEVKIQESHRDIPVIDSVNLNVL
jgi:predicted RNase H-like HicB family nuclease